MRDTTSIKTTLRSRLLADRQAIAAEVRSEWDAAIGMRLLAWWRARPLPSIGVYWPIRGEPDLRDAYEELARLGVRLALPTVIAPGAPLRFVAWTPGEPLSRDACGVPAPPATNETLLPDAVLVPCVGFNDAGIRLGYGGGFYDRTLSVEPRPLAVGIAYQCCRAEFAGEAHDVALHEVITEQSPLRVAPPAS